MDTSSHDPRPFLAVTAWRRPWTAKERRWWQQVNGFRKQEKQWQVTVKIICNFYRHANCHSHFVIDLKVEVHLTVSEVELPRIQKARKVLLLRRTCMNYAITKSSPYSFSAQFLGELQNVEGVPKLLENRTATFQKWTKHIIFRVKGDVPLNQFWGWCQ